MSSLALNKMHATFNKHHEVSPDPSTKPHQHMYNNYKGHKVSYKDKDYSYLFYNYSP